MDGAIADFTKAIELKPDSALAYHNRGVANEAKNDFDAAIADYTKAIEFNPRSLSSYNNRASAKNAKGDVDGAIADLTKAVELDPNYAEAYNGRGYIRYEVHDFRDALLDFRKFVDMRKMVPLDTSDDYVRFRLWLLRARLGEEEAATAELRTYLAGSAYCKPDDWAWKIGHFLTGELAESQFLAAIKNPNQKMEAEHSCEAYFYAGSKHLFAGDNVIAKHYFMKSIATDIKHFTEYTSAMAEMKFLKAQGN